MASRATGSERLGLAGELVSTSLRYALTIRPRAARELACWRALAGRIPDSGLRGLALRALAKRGNMLGAALFAVLAPRSRRAPTVRALVAFQTAYNYLDLLAEQPSADPIRNGRRLHGALLDALGAGTGEGDYYAHHPRSEDGGFLMELVEACSTALAELPSYVLVEAAAAQAAARIVDFQSLNLGMSQGTHSGLERWACASTTSSCEMQWWETAAAGGSSLPVHVQLALAARSQLDPSEPAAVEAAYFPSIAALHSLLDSMVDIAEDERDGQRSLVGYYACARVASERMRVLAERANRATESLAAARRHRVIVMAMTAHYLAARDACSTRALVLARGASSGAGALARPALAASRFAHVAAQLPGVGG